jgi:hypothetical protein
MEKTDEIRLADRSPWITTLVSLTPLWLLSVALMAEGFPHPPIPIGLAFASFVCAITANVVLLWKRWMAIELVLYSLIPFVLLFTFDEISTTYKTLYIILVATILSAGILGFQRSRSVRLRWLFLLVAAGLTWIWASNASANYWELVNKLGNAGCYPACLPPLELGHFWRTIFFGF